MIIDFQDHFRIAVSHHLLHGLYRYKSTTPGILFLTYTASPISGSVSSSVSSIIIRVFSYASCLSEKSLLLSHHHSGDKHYDVCTGPAIFLCHGNNVCFCPLLLFPEANHPYPIKPVFGRFVLCFHIHAADCYSNFCNSPSCC